MIKTLLLMNNCRFTLGVTLLWLCAMPSWADDDAVSFASQAGVVAGAAQACGQSIDLMTSRTNAVINALAINANDATSAMGAYQQAVSDAAASQKLSMQMTCPKVISDFNNLPLLQADYQQKVIDPLMKSRLAPNAPPSPTATTNLVTAPNANPAATTLDAAAAAAQANGTTMANLAGQQPVPLQQVVTANSNPGANPNPVANQTPGTTPANPSANNEAARLQLAQQLAQMAQNLVANQPQAQAQLQQQFTTNPYQSSIGYQTANPQVNQSLNGIGANNPAITNPLGMQPYAPGQTVTSAANAATGTQPYPYSP